jgi:hypothetical protein
MVKKGGMTLTYPLPCENWIKFMLAEDGATNKQVCDSLSMYGVYGAPNSYYLDALRQRIGHPPKHPSLKRGWYRRRKLLALYRNTENMQKARDILGNSRVRSCLETLLLAQCEADLIPQYTKRITGLKVPSEVGALYGHYFWDITLLSREQWYLFLKDVDHPERFIFMNAHRNGVEFALWKQGYREKLDHTKIAEVGAHEAIMRFFETGSMLNDRHTALTASLWVETYMKFVGHLKDQGGGLDEVINRLQSIAMKLDTTPIADIDEVTKGMHSDVVGASK